MHALSIALRTAKLNLLQHHQRPYWHVKTWARLVRMFVDKTPADHHKSWFPYLVTGDDSTELQGIAGGYLSILAPRGSAKSTWLALYAAFAIGLNPHIQIIYVGYSESVALKQSRMIKRIIASKKYRQVFPHIRPGKSFSDRSWEIDKEYAGVTTLDSEYSFYAVGCAWGHYF